MDINTDVLIAGTGIAGLYCALSLRSDLRITLLSKSKIYETNTYLAQGGISTARDRTDIPAFIEDTLRAGKYKNNINAVNILAEESMSNIEELINLGLELDKIDDKLLYTKEGAHSINRIVHCKDTTGKYVAEALISKINERQNITILEDTSIVDLLSNNNICYGAIVVRDGIALQVSAKIVVLATGGIGGIFNNSTNQRTLTGDGLAIALRNNIKLRDLNYIQFHPTVLYSNEKEKRRFLISEALRGEGAKLTNSQGLSFVNELLPRDIVSQAIYNEINRSGVPYVNLDISFRDETYIKSRFPSIYKECLSQGIDITKEPIPVSPAQHYFMGGIEVDTFSRTSMGKLYAMGEVSCTGIHGANRLASNSLLEGLVFSRRGAISINNEIDMLQENSPNKIKNNKTITNLINENYALVAKLFKEKWENKNNEQFNCG